MGIDNVKLEAFLGRAANLYQVVIDGEPWCYTTDDDDGLKLGIAITKLYLQRGNKNG